jgi:hypothetical protein
MKQVAVTQRAALEGEVTADERAEAEKRAAAWRKAHAPQEE